MVTKTNARTTKTATAKAAEQATQNESIVIDAEGNVVEPNDSREWSWAACKEAVSRFEMSAGAKSLIGFIANLVTIGASYYLGMTFTIGLAALVAGMTGSAFLTFLILFVGQVISILLALYSGATVQRFIVEDGYKSILNAPAKLGAWLNRAKAAVNKTAEAM